MLGRKTFRAQSAMEYLMTYGWAILIIAVVLGALFSLGVFSGSSLLGTSCIASPGYYCQSPTLLTTGTMSLNFGQNTGSTLYNIQMACTATTSTAGYPNNAMAWTAVPLSGAAGLNVTPLASLYSSNTPYGGWTNSLSLASGQTISVSNIPCYGAISPYTILGNTIVPVAVGTTFSGFIWLNYTSSPTSTAKPGASSNPWYTLKVATITIKVV